MRGLPVMRIRPWTLAAFMPTLRTVSSMPGIDFSAPERTETNSGVRASPSRRLVAASSQPIPATTPLRIAFVASSSPAMMPAQSEVGRTKAGGTGRRSAFSRASSAAFDPTCLARIGPADPPGPMNMGSRCLALIRTIPATRDCATTWPHARGDRSPLPAYGRFRDQARGCARRRSQPLRRLALVARS